MLKITGLAKLDNNGLHKTRYKLFMKNKRGCGYFTRYFLCLPQKITAVRINHEGDGQDDGWWELAKC